jgi:HK97 gp10 family phage protein
MAEVVIGFGDLMRRFQQLENSLQRKELTNVAKAGAQIVLDDYKANVASDTGALAEGILMRVSGRESDINEVSVDVGADKKQFYSRFVEKGTKYMRGDHALATALERNRDRITEAMKEKMIEAIERAAK